MNAPRPRPGDVEAEAPGPLPHTGYLTPQGLLYPCTPWNHGPTANEILRSNEWYWVTKDSLDLGGDALCKVGFLNVGRQDKAVHAPEGGLFDIYGATVPTEAQVAVLLRWLENGASLKHHSIL